MTNPFLLAYAYLEQLTWSLDELIHKDIDPVERQVLLGNRVVLRGKDQEEAEYFKQHYVRSSKTPTMAAFLITTQPDYLPAPEGVEAFTIEQLREQLTTTSSAHN